MSIKNNFYSARNPAIQFVTYVLSNGASLRMGIATAQAGPRYANLVSAWNGMGARHMACTFAGVCTRESSPDRAHGTLR